MSMAIYPVAAGGLRDWQAQVDRAPIALLYKHSPWCGVSMEACGEILGFADANPTVPVYEIDVIRERDLSRHIAAVYDVRHASPQVILLRHGSPVWVTSHFGIRGEALEGAVRNARDVSTESIPGLRAVPRVPPP